MRHMQCLLAVCLELLTVVSVIASENALMLLAIAVKSLFVTAVPLLSF